VALVAALVAVGARRYRRLRLDRADARRSGSTLESAIYVRSFTEIDTHLSTVWCRCGGYLGRLGEGSRAHGERRYRVARLECYECDRVREIYFDTTDILH